MAMMHIETTPLIEKTLMPKSQMELDLLALEKQRFRLACAAIAQTFAGAVQRLNETHAAITDGFCKKRLREVARQLDVGVNDALRRALEPIPNGGVPVTFEQRADVLKQAIFDGFLSPEEVRRRENSDDDDTRTNENE